MISNLKSATTVDHAWEMITIDKGITNEEMGDAVTNSRAVLGTRAQPYQLYGFGPRVTNHMAFSKEARILGF